MNLLESSSKTLTIDQYNLFSQVIVTYDEQLAFAMTERFLSEQHILPLKLRFKCASVQTYLQSLFSHSQDIFVKNHHFRLLSSHDRSILVRGQMKYLLLFSSSFIIEQTHLLDYLVFQKTIDTLFGRWIFIPNQLGSFDIPLIKFSLSMICFSSFDYTRSPSSFIHDRSSVQKCQDIYVEILWQYLIHVYTEDKARKYVLNLIECFLRAMSNVNLLDQQDNFFDMVEIVIKQTEQSF